MKKIEPMITGIILLVVGIIIAFNVIGNSAASIKSAATNVSSNFTCTGCSDTNYLPLSGLFANGGVIQLVMMAGFLLVIVLAAMAYFKHKK